MASPSLDELLLSLSSLVVDYVRSPAAAADIQTIALSQTMSRVEQFRYENGYPQMVSRYDEVPQTVRVLKSPDTMIKTLEPSVNFEEAAKRIAIRKKLALPDARSVVKQFLDRTLRIALQDDTSHTAFRSTAAFVDQLEGRPPERDVFLLLDGVTMELESVTLAEGILLRRPSASDFEGPTLPGVALTEIHHLPSAILELRHVTTSEDDLAAESLAIIRVLRLFRLGSVAVISRRVQSALPSVIGGSFTVSSQTVTRHKYVLRDTDAGALAELFTLLLPLIRKLPLAEAMSGQKPLSIAAQRYDEALTQMGDIEHSLTAAMTCMESLYLKAQERSELNHRLSQRAAVLLSFLGEVPSKVYTNLSRAYEVRSTYIHGAVLDKEDRKAAAPLVEPVLNYARASLLALLQMETHLTKDEVLNKLERVMLDPAARAKFESGVIAKVHNSKQDATRSNDA